MNSKVYSFGVAIIIVLLGILGIAYVAAKRAQTVSEAPTSQPVATTTSTPGYTIKKVPLDTLQSIMPSLDRKIVFGQSVPADARALLQAQVDRAVLALKKDSTNGNEWYNLAIYYHEADDFEGARLVWEFLTKGVPPPANAVAYENLGKLYHFDLKEYPKAEANFTAAMKANPTSIDPYMELYELYLYSYKKETTAAVDILTEAAMKFPENSDPYYVLGTYYRDKGDATDARIAFNKAMDRARSAANVSAISTIGAELAKLPQ